jgi:hypothetical protein
LLGSRLVLPKVRRNALHTSPSHCHPFVADLAFSTVFFDCLKWNQSAVFIFERYEGTEAGSGTVRLAGAMGAVTYPQSRSGLGKSPQTIPHLSNGQ